MFNLIWKDVIVDTAGSADEAALLAYEYMIASGGDVVTVQPVATQLSGSDSEPYEYSNGYVGDQP